MSAPLTDQHGRRKRKLRVSLTDRCNFRCTYCMPEQPIWLPKKEVLSNAERFRLLRLFVTELGIGEIRLTGGEPLLRPDVEARAAELRSLADAGLQKLALTTNGQGLARRATALRAAGIDSVNVSLDAISPAGFARLTGGRGKVSAVQEGIVAAREAGLKPKINAVILAGENEDEIIPLARWAAAQSVPLRLIEFMPLDDGGQWRQSRVFSEQQMLAVLEREFAVRAEAESSDPARYYTLDGAHRLGIISTISRPFCTRCDRLRLTADGQLYSCLFSANGKDLRGLMRAGASDDDLLAAIRGEVFHKQSGYAAGGYVERPISMHALGG